MFGAFPSGVTAVAALADGAPVGMAASSFTSVSLDPALVSICVAHGSTTWSVLRDAPRLGVEHPVGRAGDMRGGSSVRAATIGSPVWTGGPPTDGAVLLDGASGWLDTSIEQQVRAGDHDIVVLAVHDLDADHDISPLVFHASQFRRLH